MDRIDVHHHFIPPCYMQAFAKAGGDPSGWHLPNWSVESSLEFMDRHAIRTAILSLTAPGAAILSGDAEASTLARQVNEYAASVRDRNPSRFSFFAALPPFLGNIDAVLEEIAYALDVFKADGVTMFTRYGHDNHYLGHPDFRSIWDDLDRRGAVVFIHPTHLVDSALVNSQLPQPVIDYPHETTRTATDLIISNTLRNHPRCKVILSHAGGTFPYLATRAAHLSYDAGLSKKDPVEFLEEARNLYYDLALSSNSYTLEFITKFAKPGHILYGSDFPYAPTKTISTHVEFLDRFEMSKEQALSIVSKAALELLPRLREPSDQRIESLEPASVIHSAGSGTSG